MTVPTTKQLVALIERALKDAYPDAYFQVGPSGIMIANSEAELFKGKAILVTGASGMLEGVPKKTKVKKKNS